MKIVYSPDYKLHNPPKEIYDDVKEDYSEKPERIDSILKTLREKNIGEIIEATKFPDEEIDALHHPAYREFLKTRSEKLSSDEILYPSYFITDTYIAITPGTYTAAKSAVDTSLTATHLIMDGERLVYALTRPPGHHAEERSMGGYCFFNNAAIAANLLSEEGKVAILDIDFHHGNGTQNMFYERDDVVYLSIHADPKVKYPYKSGFVDEIGRGRGEGFNRNYPLPLGTGDAEYMQVLKHAIEDIQIYKPDYLVLSAGFDTFEFDPIGGFRLTVPFYEEIGKEIKKLNIPTLVIQEGGYAIDALGDMAHSLLKGLYV